MEPLPSLKSVYRRLMVPSEVLLSSSIEENPLYPFSPDFDDPSVLEIKVRYRSLYIAVFFATASLIALVIWIPLGGATNSLFLLPVAVLVACLATIYNDKDIRIYTLFTRQLEYQFSHNKKVHIRGHYYNIYIRLRKEVRSGTKYYYLVLNGFQIDSRKISGISTKLEAMRTLGQKIAENLNLNYFDESNTSQHHVIRHFRSDAKVFSYRSTAATELTESQELGMSD
ncbi:uncharacterized protein BJ171DRAFT_641686 [Polychytrium aggregatum]|uniref:uncharacterized protein n=1 Tax=Polychytrium aggregatum TaxID=110093 RepID=UPI0022FF00F4|nr:uncharacterized protein BJ171DRAFT_641686 [Polychytrium aggregatum]KAI9206883.1 hypothetical protein BJ171DRAFT_641686 [Polychytrium aggregatum]